MCGWKVGGKWVLLTMLGSVVRGGLPTGEAMAVREAVRGVGGKGGGGGGGVGAADYAGLRHTRRNVGRAAE
jgi:hypothetical protein